MDSATCLGFKNVLRRPTYSVAHLSAPLEGRTCERKRAPAATLSPGFFPPVVERAEPKQLQVTAGSSTNVTHKHTSLSDGAKSYYD